MSFIKKLPLFSVTMLIYHQAILWSNITHIFKDCVKVFLFDFYVRRINDINVGHLLNFNCSLNETLELLSSVQRD